MRLATLVLPVLLAAPVTAQTLLRDINPGPGGAATTQVVEWDGLAYFDACSDAACGLWRTDGTPAGTVEVAPGVFSQLTPTPFGLYLVRDGGTAAEQFLRYDGTSFATIVIEGTSTPLQVSDTGVATDAGQVFVGDPSAQRRLWTVSHTGTEAAPVVGAEMLDAPAGLAVVGDGVVFWADDGATGSEPYRFGSTGVVSLGDQNPGPGGSRVGAQSAVLDGRLYFVGRDAAGDELWRTDGATVERVADLNPGAASAFIRGFAVADGRLYFTATDAASGAELRRTDGTTVELVDNLAAGAFGAVIHAPVALGAEVYVPANPGTGTGFELYRTAGAGMTLVGELWPGSTGAFPQSSDGFRTAVLDDYLYVEAASPDVGRELYRVTEGGTLELAADTDPGTSGGGARLLTGFAAGGVVLYVSSDGASGRELWALDPATLVADEAPARGGAPALRASPNPSRGAVALTLHVPAAGEATVTVHDVRGRTVARLHEGPLAAGAQRFTWDAEAPAGVYLVRARTDAGTVLRRITRLR